MKKIYLFLLGFLGLHLFILSNLQFTAWPEMLSFPYMVDKGLLMYKDFHHVYQPLLTFILLIYFKFAGFSPVSLKILTWVSILLTDLLVFAVSKQLCNNKWLSLVPVALYVIFQPLFEGNMMWFDMAMVIPLLLSIYFVLKWSSDKKNIYLFSSGLFISISFLIKQQAVLVLIPFFFYLLKKKISVRKFTIFGLGASIPVAILLASLVFGDILKDYFFWTFQFPLYWLPKFPGYAVLPSKKEWLIIFLMVVIPATGVVYGLLKKQADSRKVFIYGIFLTLLMSAFPRFSFFHLQPFLALFVVSITFLMTKKSILLTVFATITVIYVFISRSRATIPELSEGVRFYGNDEIQLIQYINSVTTPNDKIYLLGPHSAEYVYADRVPPKPWIENYIWHFEIPGLQEKVIEGWKIDSPKFIFWTPPADGNWFDLGTYQPGEIVKYIEDNYKKVDKLNGVEVWRLK